MIVLSLQTQQSPGPWDAGLSHTQHQGDTAPAWTTCQQVMYLCDFTTNWLRFLGNYEVSVSSSTKRRRAFLWWSSGWETLHLPCRGHEFDPWSENWDSTCWDMWPEAVRKKWGLLPNLDFLLFYNSVLFLFARCAKLWIFWSWHRSLSQMI